MLGIVVIVFSTAFDASLTIAGQLKVLEASPEMPGSSVKPEVGLLAPNPLLLIVVLTIKLPETDFVLVMERAALRKTFDFELDLSAPTLPLA